jgi:hypothetical protein
VRRSNAVPLGRAYLTLAALAASAGLVAACGTDEEEENVYCGDADGYVVEDYLCDDDYNGGYYGGGPYFFYVGPYGPGLRPGARLLGGAKISPTDTAARSRYGLSTTGRIVNGTAVSGGFGSGRSGGSSGG